MKKTLSLILVLMVCISLCACSGGSKFKLSAEKVKSELTEGILDMETSGDNVISFTYVVEDVNAKDLANKSYARSAFDAYMVGNPSKITLGQLSVGKAIVAVMVVEGLFQNDDEDFNAYEFSEQVISIICDGKTSEHDGWKVSAKIDKNADSIKITATSK